MMKKTILAVAILAAISTPAMAGKCDPEILFVDGVLTHGLVCNPGWLDRPAPREAAAIAARDCNQRRSIKSMIGGAKAFDRKVKKLGHDRACKSLDEDMAKLDAVMAIPDSE
jgi:hypothetical protein